MKRRRAGWPPLTSAKKASVNVAGLDRAVAEQNARSRPSADDQLETMTADMVTVAKSAPEDE